MKVDIYKIASWE